MHPTLTKEEMELFNKAGFSVTRELLIKKNETFNSIEALFGNDDENVKITRDYKLEVFNVHDKNQTLILAGIESEDDLVQMVRRLVADMM